MTISGRIIIGLFWLVSLAAVLIVPQLAAELVEIPARVGLTWIHDTFGTAGLVILLGSLTVGGVWWHFRDARRDQTRRYAADRTIHVEQAGPPRTLASKITLTLVLSLLAGIVAFGFYGMITGAP